MLEYGLSGVIDRIAFGAAGSELAVLLVASSSLKQLSVLANGASAVPHQSAVWMIELQSQRVLQVATGGTVGESIVTTADGRILVAQSGHVDEIAPIHTPHVTATRVPHGPLPPLPPAQTAAVVSCASWPGR